MINTVLSQGTLSRADLEQCLRSFFPLKDDESIEALMKACEQEAPGESVQYKNLFTEVRITEQNSKLCDLEGVSSKLTHTFYTSREIGMKLQKKIWGA